MKKLFAIFLAAMMVLALSVSAFAADEVEIPLDADHVGAGAAKAEELTIADGAITANEIGIFALTLPETVADGDTVVVHIKGTTDGDFRAWLLAAPDTQSTFSNQWKASENGFTAPGEFEKYIELTAQDFDNSGKTEADAVAFKAPSYDAMLENLTLTYVGVVYGSMADIEADYVAEAQPFADAAAAALEAAKAASDESALNAALADAQAAVDSLTEKAELGFPGVTSLLTEAKNVVKEINDLINSAAADEALEGIKGDVDKVNSALEAAKKAGNDIDAIKAALADAEAAAANIDKAAEESNFSELTTASKDARSVVSEIEKLLSDAEAAKAAEEEEAAAKKQQTTTIVIIVVAVVVVVAVIAGIVVGVLKKKKK